MTKHDKYIWFSQTGREQYFNLDSDPQELDNKINAPDCGARIKKLRKFLVSELNGRVEGYSDGKKLISGKKSRSTLF